MDPLSPQFLLDVRSAIWKFLDLRQPHLLPHIGTKKTFLCLWIMIKKVCDSSQMSHLLCLYSLYYWMSVPIYGASTRHFLFRKEDFAALPSFPRYKKEGDRKYADVPVNGLVSIFFGMNTYMSARVPPTPGSSSRSHHDPQTPGASGSSSNNEKSSSQVLSLNLQFIIYHGQVLEAEEDD